MKIKLNIYLLIFFSFLIGQEPAGNGQTTAVKKTDASKKKKTMEEALKGKEAIEGLFTLYQGKEDGKLHMLIKSEQLKDEYIHFVHGLNGQLNAGVFKGNYRGARVFKLKRYFNRIEFEVQNNSFYYDPKNPISKSAGSNVSTAILASCPIVSEKDDQILIGVDNVFLSEALHQITRGFRPGSPNKNPFKLGKLAKDRTKYITPIKNYPENTDVVVQYVYSNPMPTNRGSDRGITDPRSLNVTLQHTFLKMPENNYKPRFEDPRVGYFTTQTTDMTVPDDVTPYRDMIHRWHLEKKDPGQDKSEVKEPITWWIENTTPIEFREVVKEGVLLWNKAFENAGFINAIEVKVQPDDAEWDAGDIRYNVLRWTSSPNPPFGGYGPSFVNPRTGQILGADIMLEYVYFTNRVKYEEIYDTYSSFDEFEPNHGEMCFAPSLFHQGNLFSSIVSGSIEDFSNLKEHRIIYESLVSLTLHEVGHTLGLNHNFFSSNLHNLKNIHDRHITEPVGLVSSVMDYVPSNISPDKKHQGQFYTTTPGPYDIWAIQFGYEQEMLNPQDEKERQEVLLEKSTNRELMFGNDSDDMRSPGKGIDPRIMIGDLTSDPMGYAKERMEIIKKTIPTLKVKFDKKDQSYHALKDAFLVLHREYASASRTISRYVGGVYMDRSMSGQVGKNLPFRPVPRSEQKWAMTLLEKNLFSPDAFDVSEDIISHLQYERRGFSGTYDPDLNGLYLGVQKGILDQLLHKNVLKRMSNTEHYGNTYTVNEMMSELTDACFSYDSGSNVNITRRNLQVELMNRYIKMLHNKGSLYDHISISAAHNNLLKIKKFSIKTGGMNEATKQHRKFLTYRIDKALETNN
tara:strand:- start:400 stop:2958 length:2559 start_codon:yes stop_codon:yes gene_type:complete